MKRILPAAVVMVVLFAFTTVNAAELHGIVVDRNGKPVVVEVVIKDSKGVGSVNP